MATATETYRDYLTAQAGQLTNEELRLSTLMLIERWYPCAAAVAALMGNQLASYSIAGRSVTKRDLPDLQRQEALALAQIRDALYMAGIHLADARGFYANSWPVAQGASLAI